MTINIIKKNKPTYTHTYIHTHICTYIHTYIHTRQQNGKRSGFRDSYIQLRPKYQNPPIETKEEMYKQSSRTISDTEGAAVYRQHTNGG